MKPKANESNIAETTRLSRREALARLLAGVAVGATWPLAASTHPIYAHLENSALLDRADPAQKSATWKPLFLTADQDRTLVPLSEAIVPGSAKAHVNRFIDLLLSVDTAEHQSKFTASLSAISKESEQRFERAFESLTAAEQEKLLTESSQGTTTREHFDNLKEWVAGAYYSSEEGMRELGWDGTHAFAKFPGCEHGEGSH